MKNTILRLVLIGAVLSGILAYIKMADDSLLIKFVAQQEQILALLKKIELRINTTSSLSDNRILNLESRLSRIEDKIGGISMQLQIRLPAERPRPPEEDYTKVYDIPIGTSPVRGKAENKVTIIAFLDLQCPYSARFQPAIDQILASYPGRVNYVIKHFPLFFHEMAKPAAKALLAAREQGKYWEMADLILKDNKDLNKKRLDDLAKTLKLDMRKFSADLKNKDAEWNKLIQEDFELGNKVEVLGTPTYFINCRKTKSRDLESFKKEIDAILSQQ